MTLDMGLTLLNREQYKYGSLRSTLKINIMIIVRNNIVHAKKRFVFRSSQRSHGHSDIISISDLLRFII